MHFIHYIIYYLFLFGAIGAGIKACVGKIIPCQSIRFWLDDPVMEYIEKNPGVERIEVVHHFHIVEATMTAIHNLEKAGRIYKQWYPRQLPQGTTCLYPI